jgi:hypothetical protein
MKETASAAPRRTPRARLSEGARVVLVNVAVLAVLAVVGELILGTWLLGANLGTLNVNTKVAHYNRDRYGLRGNYGSDPARINLLAVGGSTTNEVTVGDGDTWSSILRRTPQGSRKIGLYPAGKLLPLLQ